MAQKTIMVSDISGDEIDDHKGAQIRIIFRDARRGVHQMDVTDAEADELALKGGKKVARRGRRPRNAEENGSVGGEEGGDSELGNKVASRGGRGKSS